MAYCQILENPKQWDLGLELFDRSEIWPDQISEQRHHYNNLVAFRRCVILDKTAYLLVNRGPDDIFKWYFLNQNFLLWFKFPSNFSIKLI